MRNTLLQIKQIFPRGFFFLLTLSFLYFNQGRKPPQASLSLAETRGDFDEACSLQSLQTQSSAYDCYDDFCPHIKATTVCVSLSLSLSRMWMYGAHMAVDVQSIHD